MDKIILPASITLERGFATKKYKWKSRNKVSNYRIPCKRAAIRFTCRNFADKISKIKRDNRQILVEFKNNSNVVIKRIKSKGISVQGYSGEHPYIQIVINRCLPKKLWKILEQSNSKSKTFSINVELDLSEWRDVNLIPSDFLLEVEKESKGLMDKALAKGFSILKVSKGREYDIGLISPTNKEIIIAISSHVAKSNSRTKEKTVQKILMDISKMLPYIDQNKKAIPVVITKPIEFERSWSFTTQKYLEFYRKKFGFRFITTEFKNKWEDDIIKELSKI